MFNIVPTYNVLGKSFKILVWLQIIVFGKVLSRDNQWNSNSIALPQYSILVKAEYSWSNPCEQYICYQELDFIITMESERNLGKNEMSEPAKLPWTYENTHAVSKSK